MHIWIFAAFFGTGTIGAAHSLLATFLRILALTNRSISSSIAVLSANGTGQGQKK